MYKNFKSAWFNCLDEPMSIWTNWWTCPEWVFCPRKPHSFRNEYCTICCGLSEILFWLELVEGSDRPKEMSSDPKHKITIGLLQRLRKTIFSTGKVVILDSGFCVLERSIELKKIGVYTSARIKKCPYWPNYVPGDLIDEHI